MELFKREIVVTFDDGYNTDYIASKILKFLGIPSIHFINPCTVGKRGYLTMSDITSMATWAEIGSHTFCHNTVFYEGNCIWPKKSEGYYNELTVTRYLNPDYEIWLKSNLIRSKEFIEKLTSTKCNNLAWPWGESDSLMNHIALAVGFENLYNTGFGRNGSNPIKRIAVRPILIERLLHSVIFFTFPNSIANFAKAVFKAVKASQTSRARSIYNQIHDAIPDNTDTLLVGCSDYCRPKSAWSCVEINYKRAYTYGNANTECMNILDWEPVKKFSNILVNGVVGYGVNKLGDIFKLLDKCYDLVSESEANIYISLNDSNGIEVPFDELGKAFFEKVKNLHRFDKVQLIGADNDSLNYRLYKITLRKK